MAQELLQSRKAASLHDKVAGKCMPEVMEGEIL